MSFIYDNLAYQAVSSGYSHIHQRLKNEIETYVESDHSLSADSDTDVLSIIKNYILIPRGFRFNTPESFLYTGKHKQKKLQEILKRNPSALDRAYITSTLLFIANFLEAEAAEQVLNDALFFAEICIGTTNDHTEDLLMGDAYYYLGMYDEAKEHYNFVNENRKTAHSLCGITKCLMHENDGSEELAATIKSNLDEVISSIGLESAEAYFLMGIVAEEEDRVDDAIDYYKKSIDVNCAFAEASFRLGKLYWDTAGINPKDKYYKNVEQYLLYAINLNPHCYDYYIFTGKALLTRPDIFKSVDNHFEAAQKYANKAKFLDLTRPEAHHLLGATFKAYADALMACDIDNEDDDQKLLSGDIDYSTNQYPIISSMKNLNEALECFNEALRYCRHDQVDLRKRIINSKAAALTLLSKCNDDLGLSKAAVNNIIDAIHTKFSAHPHDFMTQHVLDDLDEIVGEQEFIADFCETLWSIFTRDSSSEGIDLNAFRKTDNNNQEVPSPLTPSFIFRYILKQLEDLSREKNLESAIEKNFVSGLYNERRGSIEYKDRCDFARDVVLQAYDRYSMGHT